MEQPRQRFPALLVFLLFCLGTDGAALEGELVSLTVFLTGYMLWPEEVCGIKVSSDSFTLLPHWYINKVRNTRLWAVLLARGVKPAAIYHWQLHQGAYNQLFVGSLVQLTARSHYMQALILDALAYEDESVPLFFTASPWSLGWVTVCFPFYHRIVTLFVFLSCISVSQKLRVLADCDSHCMLTLSVAWVQDWQSPRTVPRPNSVLMAKGADTAPGCSLALTSRGMRISGQSCPISISTIWPSDITGISTFLSCSHLSKSFGFTT